MRIRRKHRHTNYTKTHITSLLDVQMIGFKVLHAVGRTQREMRCLDVGLRNYSIAGESSCSDVPALALPHE